MLQSLIPQSPIIDSTPSISSMKTKRAEDPQFLSRKRPNSGENIPILDQEAGQDEGLQPPPPSPPAPEFSVSIHGSLSSSFTRGMHLLRLLLQCAECVSTDDLDGAAEILPEITELSSPFGTPPERVAAYFAHALQSRVISTFLPHLHPHSSLRSIKTLATLDQTHKICSALQSYNSISPLIKFSHFTANQAIFEALDSEDRLHVVDLDIMQGLQWPGLFHILAASRSRWRKPIRSVRITGFGPSLPSLEATGRRLAEFATSLGLPFEFTPVQGKFGTLTDLTPLLRSTDEGGEREATVVHCVHHSLYDVTGDDFATLRLLTLVKPKLITIVEQDLNLNQQQQNKAAAAAAEEVEQEEEPFLGRFVEALHYYSALFDALGEGGLGEDSAERHTVEQQVFGREIMNVLSKKRKKKKGKRKVVVGRWAEEMRRVGFRGVSLGGNPAAQAGMLLGMLPWKGYTLVVEENGWLKLGWKDLSLLTASAWEPFD